MKYQEALVSRRLIGRLIVQEFDNRQAMGEAAAADIAQAMRTLLAERERIRMVFAAAPSQNEMLNALCREELPWDRVVAFHMDEYVGLPTDAPQRFGRFLQERLFGLVHPGAVHYLDGQAEPEAECERYAALLGASPIDIVCLGIGENGHLAFNDPPVADFSDGRIVKPVKLDETCRRQQVNDGCFARVEEVPGSALTLTIPTLLSASRLFCVIPGPTKREAIRRTLMEKISTECPATIMREHPGCTLYVDRDSAGGLSDG